MVDDLIYNSIYISLLTIIILLYILYPNFGLLEKKKKRKKEKKCRECRECREWSVCRQNPKLPEIRNLHNFGKVVFLPTLPTLFLHSLNSSFVVCRMLNASTDFRFFFGIYHDYNDSNMYIEFYIWISLPKAGHLQGEIHVRHPI